MAVRLRVDRDRIEQATFETYGCSSAMACGRYVTEWLEGKTVSEAAQLTWEQVALDGDLPLGKEHCAQLAVGALTGALRRLDGATGGGE